MHFRKQFKEEATKRFIDQTKHQKIQEALDNTRVKVDNTNKRIVDPYKDKKKVADNTKEFSKIIKESLLYDALDTLYSESYRGDTGRINRYKAAVLNTFIKENGATKIMTTMENSTLLNREIVRAIKETHDEIMKANAEKLNNPSCDLADCTVDPDCKDSFINKLHDQKEEIEDVGSLVQTHVANSMEEFIQSNIEDKTQIKDILKDVQAKVDEVKASTTEVEEEIKESVIKKAKYAIKQIQKKEKPIFECMVSSLAKKAINEDIKRFLVHPDNTVNMDAIVGFTEHVMTMLVLSEALGFKIDEKEVRELYK